MAPGRIPHDGTSGYYNGAPYWSPSTASIAPGGSVAFSYPSGTSMHYPVFSGPSAPACTGVPNGNPVGSSLVLDTAGWSGSCTFPTAGTYTFVCGVHGAVMSGTIYVGTANGGNGAGGATGTSTGYYYGGGGSNSNSNSGTGTGSGGGTGTSGGDGGAGGGTGTPASGPAHPAQGGGPPAGAGLNRAAPAGGGAQAGIVAGSVHVAPLQRGSTVKGMLTIARAGSRLEADLLGSRTGASPATSLGTLVRPRVAAGVFRFAVHLTPAGRRALQRAYLLKLALRVDVTPPGGATQTVIARLVLRR